MARTRAAAVPGQLTIAGFLDSLTRRAEVRDPLKPATRLFLIVLALSGLGLLVQVSHAATTLSLEAFAREVRTQLVFRAAGVAVLLGAYRLGPSGLRRFVPHLLVASFVLLVLVFVEPFAAMRNGAHRWVEIAGFGFQPSELARLVVVLWVADRCVCLGHLVYDLRRGVLPMLALALVFFCLVACETDIGGAMLLLLCAFATMWVGGARPTHVIGTFTTIAGTALAIGFTAIPYVRYRIESFFGDQTQQISDGLVAMQSGGLWGLGLGQGIHRNLGVPYLESDLVFAQVGEELGLVGMVVVLLLYVGLLWHGLMLLLRVGDRFDALASFGLLVSTALQAMLHVQVVAGLAPPKGMTLPFVSHGGTSMVVSCLGIGLALGAARRSAEPAREPSASTLLLHGSAPAGAAFRSTP